MERRSVTAEVDFERRLVASLVMSPKLLKDCTEMANPDMFTPGPCQHVARWCWEYFSKVGDAPQRAIEDLYLAKAMDLGETDSEGVKTFLASISDNYTPPNEALMLKEATRFFKLRAGQKLKDGLERALLVRDEALIESLVADYVVPERMIRSSTSLFGCNPQEIISAFNRENVELFSFPGDAAREVMGTFNRTDFVSFSAPMKRGKTWWLMKLAVTAAKNGWNVLYVSCEMPKWQVLSRMWQMCTGTSRRGELARNPKFEAAPNGRFIVNSQKEPTMQVDLRPEVVTGLQERFRTYWRGRLEVKNWPTRTLTVPMLERELKDMQVYENFVPDVIVIDYADIMRAVNTRQDKRDQLDEIWAALRGLAQDREVLIATASQTGRGTVTGDRDADDSDMAEDIRKLAHVTKNLVINQSHEEKALGIYRISNNTTRDEASAETQLVCLSRLAIGEPMLDCKLLSDCDLSGAGGEAEYSAGDSSDEPRRQRKSKKFQIGG